MEYSKTSLLGLDRVCFERPTFNMYLFILVCTLLFLFYTWIQGGLTRPHDANEIYKQEIVSDKYVALQQQINELKNGSSNKKGNDTKALFLNKIYNPLEDPSPLYHGGSFSTPSYDGYRQFQMLGYISGSEGRYPIFGRYKYSGKTDKLEYYCIDNERGRIKIPFKTKNDNELYDGDTVKIPQLSESEFVFNKYTDIDNNRYDPNVI